MNNGPARILPDEVFGRHTYPKIYLEDLVEFLSLYEKRSAKIVPASLAKSMGIVVPSPSPLVKVPRDDWTNWLDCQGEPVELFASVIDDLKRTVLEVGISFVRTCTSVIDRMTNGNEDTTRSLSLMVRALILLSPNDDREIVIIPKTLYNRLWAADESTNDDGTIEVVWGRLKYFVSQACRAELPTEDTLELIRALQKDASRPFQQPQPQYGAPLNNQHQDHGLSSETVPASLAPLTYYYDEAMLKVSYDCNLQSMTVTVVGTQAAIPPGLAALIQSHTALQEFTLQGFCNDYWLSGLAPALVGSLMRLRRVEFHGEFGDRGVEALVLVLTALSTRTSLEKVVLVGDCEDSATNHGPAGLPRHVDLRRLAGAIRELPALQELSLQGFCTDDWLLQLAPALARSSRLGRLELHGPFGDDGVEALVPVLTKRSTLEELVLVGNFGDEGAEHVRVGLHQNVGLRKLSMQGDFGDTGTRNLAVELVFYGSGLQHVQLQGLFGDKAVATFSFAIRRNRKLRSLNLKGMFTDSGADDIGLAVRKNQNLESLTVQSDETGLGEKGINSLLAAVGENRKLATFAVHGDFTHITEDIWTTAFRQNTVLRAISLSGEINDNSLQQLACVFRDSRTLERVHISGVFGDEAAKAMGSTLLGYCQSIYAMILQGNLSDVSKWQMDPELSKLVSEGILQFLNS